MPGPGNQFIRPLIGGTQIEGRRGNTTWTGTLGLIVQTSATYLLTAGHVVGDVGSKVGQPDLVAAVGEVDDNLLASGQDIAQITLKSGVSVEKHKVLTGPNKSVTVEFAKSVRPAEDEHVIVYGRVTGAVAGVVGVTDADVTEATTRENLSNVVLLHFAGNSHPVQGDSGAPVVSVPGQPGAVPKCYGVYGGSFTDKGKSVHWFTPFENITW